MKKTALLLTIFMSSNAFAYMLNVTARVSSGIHRPGFTEMVRLDDRKGTTFLAPNKIFNELQVPVDINCKYNVRLSIRGTAKDVVFLEKTDDCPGFPRDRGL